MIQPLVILLVIVGIGWLLDRGYAWAKNRPVHLDPENAPPHQESKPILPANPTDQSTELRQDWLRLKQPRKS